MKSIKELKNPDIVEINGDKFQVINNTSLWYHTDKKELEMVVELVKVGEKSLSPKYRLTYIYERPDEVKFFLLVDGEWKENEIKDIKF
ncbi:hypothetical protein ACFLQN_00970 [Candidatus Aenigmatarchaeota archaeon]